MYKIRRSFISFDLKEKRENLKCVLGFVKENVSLRNLRNHFCV
jgi:hypothetical protein